MTMEDHGAVAQDAASADRQVLADLLRAALTRVPGAGWEYSEEDFWTRVTPNGYRFQQQGWKLHVSATPLSAPVTLARCASVLFVQGCAFKFARDLERVQELVDPLCPRGSGGKFITAYPADDDEFRAVAAALDAATAGLRGPRILSDRPLAPDSVVHYRYGVAAAKPVLTNDGSFESVLIAPDGTTQLDTRHAWFAPPPWVVSPLPEPPSPGAPPDGGAPRTPTPTPTAVSLGGRFTVRRAIRHANRGGVYVAADTAAAGAEVIVKQARRHVGSRLDGDDCRDDLRHEARMLKELAPLGVTPRMIDLFEQQDSLFLAEELIPGSTLAEWALTAVRKRPPGDPGHVQATGRLATRLADLMAAVHDTGLVLRDFTPNNLIVTPDEQVVLIDLEAVTRPGTCVARRYTPGFAAPEQATAAPLGPALDQRADLYGLGATLCYLVTGVVPALTEDDPECCTRAERLTELLTCLAMDNPALVALMPVIAGLMTEDPQQRWPLDRARKFLREAVAAPARAAKPSLRAEPDLARLVDDGIAYLLRTMTPDRHRLWAAGKDGDTTIPDNVQCGAAGVLAVLARTARAGDDAEELRAGTAAAAAWLAERVDAAPRVLPGLYFGHAGAAWALRDAADRLEDEALADRAVMLAENIPLTDWGNPDVAHGIAGAGLTQLRFWRATGRDSLRRRALQCADIVHSAAEARGAETLWPVPADFNSQLAGLAHYGFAHGVAGAGAFLLYCGVAFHEETLLADAIEAGRTLAKAAVIEDGAARWPAAPGESAETGMQHWCSGASGIGTFLVRLWHVTGNQQFLDLADAAAVTVVRQRWLVGNAACHGLAGDGEFLLDLAQLTGQDRYLDGARALAGVLHARRVYRDGLAVVPGENPNEVIAGYNTGLAGVVSFLDRLLRPGPRPWLPDELLGL
jgi:serine/threonine protein kinase